MGAKRFAVAGIAAVAVLVAACGKSREQQAFDQLGQMCGALVGQQLTIKQVDAQFYTAPVISNLCCPPAGELRVPIGGTCPDQSTDNPECSIYYEWQAYDLNLCDAATGGCCFICEVRVMKQPVAATGADTPICAARWLKQQPCQFPACQ